MSHKDKNKRFMQVRVELYTPLEHEQPTYSQKLAGAYLSAADRKSDYIIFGIFQIINGRLDEHESLKYLKN